LFLIASSILNAVLVIVFVGVFHLGLAGAAATTIIGQGAAAIACVVLVAKKMPQLVPSRSEWRAGVGAISDAAKLGLPMGLQTSVMAIGAVILQGAINGLGTDAVAATTAGWRVEQLATTFIFSMGLAIVTFVAQNRGAEQWARIRHVISRMAVIASLLSVAIGVLLMVFANQLVSLFVLYDSPQVHSLAVQYLRLNGFTYWILGLKFVYRGAIQGMGDSVVPSIASVLELAMRAVAGIWLVGIFGFAAVALAAPFAWLAAVAVCLPAWLVQRRKLIDLERSELTQFRKPVATVHPETAELIIAA
jgi:Na+-driven multidrug efflux pump